jgi:hypothetical protein
MSWGRLYNILVIENLLAAMLDWRRCKSSVSALKLEVSGVLAIKAN